VNSKLFSFDTYSSNEKKNNNKSSSLQVNTVMIGKYGSKPNISGEMTVPQAKNGRNENLTIN
jgi:hypothetical protein